MDREDLIRRSDAIREIEAWFKIIELNPDILIDNIKSIHEVEPWDLYDCDEWCRDCKEYDTEHHNCPRWNRVIRRTLEENQPKQGEWIDGYDASRICGIELKVCSICGEEYNYDLAKRFNYCPNCGSRNRKE